MSSRSLISPSDEIYETRKESPIRLVISAKTLVKNSLFTLQHIAFLLWGAWLSRGIRSNRGTILITGVPGFGGGPFTFLRFLVDRLASEHRVVCSFREDEIQPELVSLCSSRGLELIPRPAKGRWTDLMVLARILRGINPQATIVNVGTFSQAFHVLALSVPILYYSHSIWHHRLPPELHFFLYFFRRYSNHRVYTVSDAAKRSLDSVYFSRAKNSPVSWLHNGIRDRGAVAHQTLPKFTILTLGSVAWYKNPDLWHRVACRVVATLPPHSVRFIWAGKGDDFERMAQRNNDSVQFVGFVADPDRLVQESSVYFQPSEFESFGLGVCEAMMFEKPIVASNVGALPELVSDGVEGFLIPLEEEERMVERLCELFREPDLRATMGSAARRKFLTRFTDQHWHDSFRRLWEQHFGHH